MSPASPDTTYADVLRTSGPLFRLRGGHRRFVVFGVTGWTNRPDSRTRQGGEKAITAWSVLDSASGDWEEVDCFVPSESLSTKAAFEKASKLAAALNE